MKLFKFEFSQVMNEERVYETILFETDNYETFSDKVIGFQLGLFYVYNDKFTNEQYDFLQQIFECVTNDVVNELIRLPGARFKITEARIITITRPCNIATI
jgi:hypothetical protein